LCLLLFWKKNWAFPTSPNVFPTMLSNNPCLKIYIYILTLVLAMSPMYFLVPLVSFDIVYRAFNPQPFGDPYCPRKKFMSNLVPLVFLTCLFNTHAKLFVVILSLRCHFFIIIFIFLLFCIFSSSLALFACVYCCWQNLNHPQNEMPHQFEFSLRMFKFVNICYVNSPSLDVILGLWPNNNHNNQKLQEKLEILDESNLH